MAYIIAIDDSELALEVTKMMLDNAGHATKITGDPHEFLAWVEGNPTPDLLIVDAIMPDIDGMELIKRLRNSANSKIANISIILASALEDADVSDLGALLLPKPFTEEELNNVISFALD
jgi:CheY-like chemotaxis protein